MTVTSDIAAFIIYTVLIFGGGWQVESWHMQSKQGDALQKQVIVTNAAQKNHFNIASQFEADTQAAHNAQDQLLEKWNEAPHSSCMLSANALRVLATATAP